MNRKKKKKNPKKRKMKNKFYQPKVQKKLKLVDKHWKKYIKVENPWVFDIFRGYFHMRSRRCFSPRLFSIRRINLFCNIYFNGLWEKLKYGTLTVLNRIEGLDSERAVNAEPPRISSPPAIWRAERLSWMKKAESKTADRGSIYHSTERVCEGISCIEEK